jgi:hypothetical protein
MNLAWLLALKLLTAHLLGDFPLQSEYGAEQKHRLVVLMRHLLVHGVLLMLVAWTEGFPRWLWAPIVGLLVAHGLIDFRSSRVLAKRRDAARGRGTEIAGGTILRVILLDQLVHLVVILGAVAVARPGESLDALRRLLAQLQDWRLYALASGFVTTVWAGSIVVGRWVQGLAMRLPKRGHGDPAPHGDEEARIGLERAGRWIGMIERTLVFLAILLKMEALVGFVIAAKALLRVPEATGRKSWALAEYYLVGTMASVAWAVVFALIVRWAIVSVP